MAALSSIKDAVMERRQQPRYPIENGFAVVQLQQAVSPAYDATFVDISVGGAGILSDASLPDSDRITLSANFNSAKPPLQIEAFIRWRASHNQQTRYGIEFADKSREQVKEYLRDVHVANIEAFIGCFLPEAIKKRYGEDWIHKKYNQDDIRRVIDFEKPFLKIEKVIVFDSFEEGKMVQKKSLSVGKIYASDVKGHYNDTIFLALCGQLMGQAASILVACLNPEKTPQIIEVENVKPSIIQDQVIWKPRKEGSAFFIDIEILRHRLSLYVTSTKVYFGNVVMGSTTGMKLFLTSKESIRNAETLPRWV